MRRKLALVMAAAAIGLLAVGTAPAAAETLQVDDAQSGQCPNAAYSSIQDAVDNAGDGDTVEVCDGSYAEQVRIEGAAKDGLILKSKEQSAASISYPAAPESPKALVTIDGADNVTVRGFNIKGPYPAADCAGEHIGVYVIGGSQAAAVYLNRVRDIRANNPALFGCQDGFGMIVEGGGQAGILLNDIRGYQKGGVVINGENSIGVALNNLVAPDESVQPFIAPNGFQVSRGAVGAIARNYVTQNICELPNDCDGDSGSGILTFEPAVGGVVVQENVVVENDDNLPLIDTDGARIEKNTLNDALDFDGIFVSGEDYFGESENNTIRNNKLARNEEHDCHDDSSGSGTGGTANNWAGNQAGTANRALICPGATVDPPLSAQAKGSRAASRAKVSPAER